MNQHRKIENGFSLIELLVATVLLAYGTLALVQLMMLGIKLNIQTKDDTQAATLAQWKIETLTGLGYQQLNPGGDLDTSVGVYFDPPYSEPGSGVVYTKRWKISNCGNANPVTPCAPSQLYFETPWYEVSVKVTTNRLEQVAGTQPRQITLKAIVIQPF